MVPSTVMVRADLGTLIAIKYLRKALLNGIPPVPELFLGCWWVQLLDGAFQVQQKGAIPEDCLPGGADRRADLR